MIKIKKEEPQSITIQQAARQIKEGGWVYEQRVTRRAQSCAHQRGNEVLIVTMPKIGTVKAEIRNLRET